MCRVGRETLLNLNLNLQLSQSLVFVAGLISQTLLPISTGYVLLSELSSNWQSLSTQLFTGLHLSTCLISD